jgi:ATP-dependent Clp protease ATP-binding subunit ClpB
MTSNVGSQIIADEHLSAKEKEEGVQKILRSTFRPEFLNRIDDTVLFNNLSEKQIGSIVRTQLRALQSRLDGRKIHVEFDNAAIQLLAERGFDPSFGARPLKRTIQSLVENELARMIIAHDVGPGDQVFATAKDGKITLKKK